MSLVCSQFGRRAGAVSAVSIRLIADWFGKYGIYRRVQRGRRFVFTAHKSSTAAASPAVQDASRLASMVASAVAPRGGAVGCRLSRARVAQSPHVSRPVASVTDGCPLHRTSPPAPVRRRERRSEAARPRATMPPTIARRHARGTRAVRYRLQQGCVHGPALQQAGHTRRRARPRKPSARSPAREKPNTASDASSLSLHSGGPE